MNDQRPSNQGLDEAVEKILADPSFARDVLQNPERALTSRFTLSQGEWRSISWSLLEDVFRAIELHQIEFNYLSQLPRLKGGIDTASDTPTVHLMLSGSTAQAEEQEDGDP